MKTLITLLAALTLPVTAHAEPLQINNLEGKKIECSGFNGKNFSFEIISLDNTTVDPVSYQGKFETTGHFGEISTPVMISVQSISTRALAGISFFSALGNNFQQFKMEVIEASAFPAIHPVGVTAVVVDGSTSPAVEVPVSCTLTAQK